MNREDGKDTESPLARGLTEKKRSLPSRRVKNLILLKVHNGNEEI